MDEKEKTKKTIEQIAGMIVDRLTCRNPAIQEEGRRMLTACPVTKSKVKEILTEKGFSPFQQWDLFPPTWKQKKNN